MRLGVRGVCRDRHAVVRLRRVEPALHLQQVPELKMHDRARRFGERGSQLGFRLAQPAGVLECPRAPESLLGTNRTRLLRRPAGGCRRLFAKPPEHRLRSA